MQLLVLFVVHFILQLSWKGAFLVLSTQEINFGILVHCLESLVECNCFVGHYLWLSVFGLVVHPFEYYVLPSFWVTVFISALMEEPLSVLWGWRSISLLKEITHSQRQHRSNQPGFFSELAVFKIKDLPQ